MGNVVWLEAEEGRWLGVAESFDGELEATCEGSTLYLKLRPN